MGRRDRSWVRAIKAIVAIAAVADGLIDETADRAERRRVGERRKGREAKRRGGLRFRAA